MDYAALFVLIALLEMLFAVLIFFFKDVLHSILSFSLLFAFNSVLFFALGNPFMGLIQLFIMVGGVATYIFVGVSSSSYSKFKHTNYLLLGISYFVVFGVLVSRVFQTNPIAPEQNTVTNAVISQSISSNLGIFYLVIVMLFGVGFGSIVLMRKLGRKK